MIVRAKESNLAKININSGLWNDLICDFITKEAAIRKAKEDAEKLEWRSEISKISTLLDTPIKIEYL